MKGGVRIPAPLTPCSHQFLGLNILAHKMGATARRLCRCNEI